jgi:predicted Zn finger-like uncharacterized protein
MILTCPNCATQFNIPDGALVPAGRTVRCSRCKTAWHAVPATAGVPAPDRSDGTIARAAAALQSSATPAAAPPPAPEVAPQRQVPPAPPTPPTPTPPTPTPPTTAVPTSQAPASGSLIDTISMRTPVAEPPPEPKRDSPREPVAVAVAPPEAVAPTGKPAATPPGRQAMRRRFDTVVWFAFVTLALGVAGAIYFHEVFAAEFPSTRPAFRATRLLPPQRGEGLRFDVDRDQLAPRDNPGAVILSGRIVNESWIPRSIRPLRATLFDAAKSELRSWELEVGARFLWPGEAVAFRSETRLASGRAAELEIKLQPLD